MPSRASVGEVGGATKRAASKAPKPAVEPTAKKVRKKPAEARPPKSSPPHQTAPLVEPPAAPIVSEAVKSADLGTEAEQTVKAEVLALLAQSDEHPAHDAIETPTRYDVLPALYARLEALLLLTENDPQIQAPAEPSDSFDPFDDAEISDDAPFDPPDERDLCPSTTPEQADAEVDEGEPRGFAVACEPLAPVRPSTPAHSPASLDYLERARRAAQDQTVGQSQPSFFGVSVEKITQFKWRIAGAAAAPLLAASAWALYAQTEGDRDAAPVAAHASEMAPTARDFVGEYRLAMQRLESGGAREGMALLRDLAEAGFPMAQYQLAKVLERGEGAPQSLAQARIWTERAASGGNCRAMHDVGVFYARGEGVARDEAMAARWFRAAAERGVADSQYNLGILFEQGRGVALDAKEALFWFLVAARNRDLNAIDRAVGVATDLSSTEVSQVQARARSFQAQAADPIANGVFEGGVAQSCAVDN